MLTELELAAFKKMLKIHKLESKRPLRRCPQCQGLLVCLRPTDISGVPKLIQFCAACYEREGP